MSSSVSSEHAFSSAGLTVTDRRNRLKGDIMEALQVMKAVFKGSGDVMKDIGITLEEELLLIAQEEAEDASGDEPIGGFHICRTFIVLRTIPYGHIKTRAIISSGSGKSSGSLQAGF